MDLFKHSSVLFVFQVSFISHAAVTGPILNLIEDRTAALKSRLSREDSQSAEY